jgi:anti-sigma B factor antagonist
MELQFNTMDSEIRKIKLIGKLDSIGTGEIKTKFMNQCAGDKIRLVVDLSEVDFLASIGVRLLVLAAKSVINRGGKMVILNPIPEVQNVLEMADIPAIIPIYSHFESAETVLTAI